MTSANTVTIYTDGSCEPNPGPGGWGALLRFGGREKVLSGSHPDTTNNRMELTAAIEALKHLKRPSQIDFYTDSEYLRRGITEWLDGWRARQWKRKGGKLKNVDLWQALDAAIREHQIEWHWVRGHAGNPDNQRVDAIARGAMRRGMHASG
ncbi:MAG: ribonuclease HI [Anaerolineae bacterium]|nr:ribonuclease HI [Anaerolineae bacterium]